MSDVTETLQELLERRLQEMGRRRGRGESISLREAWQRLPENEAGQRSPSYETFRRIRVEGHTSISDETADALATMLEVPVDQVFAAARIPPRLGRFELPGRADRLTSVERQAVLGVVDAILEAKSGSATLTARADISASGTVTELPTAARKTPSGRRTRGQQRRDELDKAGDERQE